MPLNDIAVLHAKRSQGGVIARQLKAAGVPHSWLAEKRDKLTYDPGDEKVAVMTIHSSKGLEFPRVIVLGIGQLSDSDDSRQPCARLLYVGMTRAQDYLLMTTSRDNRYSRELMEAAAV